LRPQQYTQLEIDLVKSRLPQLLAALLLGVGCAGAADLD
jgi:hypothetical protein